jgi:hypothetical protein
MLVLNPVPLFMSKSAPANLARESKPLFYRESSFVYGKLEFPLYKDRVFGVIGVYSMEIAGLSGQMRDVELTAAQHFLNLLYFYTVVL